MDIKDVDELGNRLDEITPEMINAGIKAHSGYHPEFDSLRDTLREIWLAMSAEWFNHNYKS